MRRNNIYILCLLPTTRLIFPPNCVPGLGFGLSVDIICGYKEPVNRFDQFDPNLVYRYQYRQFRNC